MIVGAVDDEPQPLSRLIPTTLDAMSSDNRIRLCFLRPKQQRANATADPGNSGFELRRSAADFAEVVTVRVVEAGPPKGVRFCGEKLHDAPTGDPEQLNETAE